MSVLSYERDAAGVHVGEWFDAEILEHVRLEMVPPGASSCDADDREYVMIADGFLEVGRSVDPDDAEWQALSNLEAGVHRC